MSKAFQNKCQSCGSSSFEIINAKTQCQHCGSVVSLAKTSSNNVIYKIIAVIVLALIIVALLFFIFTKQGNKVIKETNVAKLTITKPLSSLPKIDTSTLTITNDQVKNNKVNSVQTDLTISNELHGQTSNNSDYWIFQIHNQTNQSVYSPIVVISLFDSNGKRFEEQKGFAKNQVLKAGEKTVVMVHLQKQLRGQYTKKIRAYAKAIQAAYNKQELLKVDDFVVNKMPYGENFVEIVGDVTNNYDYQVDYVKVIAIGYDQNNQPVATAEAYVTTSSIPSKQQSGFKVKAGTFVIETPKHWSLFAVARKHTVTNYKKQQ